MITAECAKVFFQVPCKLAVGLLGREPDAQVTEVFSNTILCSDFCATASDGVCDASCPHGTDCTDCGGTPKPDVFPISLTADNGRRRAEAVGGARFEAPDSRDAPLRFPIREGN